MQGPEARNVRLVAVLFDRARVHDRNMSMSEGVASIGNVALFAAARTGDEGAWPELVRRYNKLVVGHGIAILDELRRFRRRGAEHVVAPLGADTVREPEKLGAWLATTARRECLAIVQRRVEYPKATEDLDRPSPDPLPKPP